MAHNITEIDKQQGIEQAWHGLTEIAPEINRKNIYLGQWDIEPFDLFDGQGRPTGFRALGCTDKAEIPILDDDGKPTDQNERLILGEAFRKSYTPLNNQEFLDLVFNSIAGTDHKVVSAVSVCARTKISVSVLLNLEKLKGAGREFLPYLNYRTGHGKKATLEVNTSTTCGVCDNTITLDQLFLRQLMEDNPTGQVAFLRKHSKNLKATLPEMANMVDKAIGVQAEFISKIDKLANIPCQQNRAEKIYTGFVTPDGAEKLSSRARGIVDSLLSLFTRGAGNKGENMADLFSGVTDYYSHESAGQNRWKQFVSSEFGAGANRKSEFWKACQLDKAGEYSSLTRLEDRGEKILLAS